MIITRVYIILVESAARASAAYIQPTVYRYVVYQYLLVTMKIVIWPTELLPPPSVLGDGCSLA